MTKAPTPLEANGRDAARLEKSPDTMINWLSRVATDHVATSMQFGGLGGSGAAGDAPAVGFIAGSGVDLTVGVGVGVDVGSGVAVPASAGASHGATDGICDRKTAVGEVAASAGLAVRIPEVTESKTTPDAVKNASPAANITTDRQ